MLWSVPPLLPPTPGERLEAQALRTMWIETISARGFLNASTSSPVSTAANSLPAKHTGVGVRCGHLFTRCERRAVP